MQRGGKMLLFEIRSQEEFDEYIRSLPLDSKCHFMLEKGVNLCDCLFKCRFHGRDRYTLRMGRKIECNREEAIEIMRMF